MSPHLFAVVCALSTAVLVVSEVRGVKPVRAISKTIAAFSFIAYAWMSGAGDAGAPGWWVLAALVLSMIGDLCLLSREKAFFLGGLVAFLLGHVAYIGAFAALGVDPMGTALAGTVFGGVAYGVWQWLGPHTDSLRRPVIAYIVVISTMVAMATGSVAADPAPARIGLWVAAVAFFLSDLCVARDRFIAPGPNNRIIGLPLYFGAQLGFAGTIALAV